MLTPRFMSSATLPANNVPDVSFSVVRHRSEAVGGPIDAEIAAAGNEEELLALFGLLGLGVEVYDDAGDIAWWGRATEISVSIGAISVGLSLNTMSNRIAIAYTTTDPATGQSATRATTAYVDDDDSQALYGVQELLHTLSGATATQATSLQTQLLNKLKLPIPTAGLGNRSGKTTAAIRCSGWWQTLDNRYAEWSLTPVSYTTAPESATTEALTSYGLTLSEDIGIGIGSSSSIQIVAFDIPNSLTLPALWKRIKVKMVRNGTPVDNLLVDLRTGTSSAPGTILHTITVTGTSIPAGTNTIMEFAPTDNVYRVPGQTYCLTLRRSGSVSASNYWDVHGLSTLANPNSTTKVYNGSAWVTPAANQDTFYEFAEETDSSFIDLDAVTARQRIAIPFTVDQSLAVDRITVPMARVGSPTGDVVAYICADSSGAPGSVITTMAVIAASTFPTDIADVQFTTPTTYTLLTPATTYWLQIYHNGGVNPAAFLRVMVNSALGYTGGDPKIYNGSAWVAASPNADMLFSLGFALETTDQIDNLVTLYGDFITGIDIETTSSVWTDPTRNGDVKALQCVTEMLESGNSTGTRLLAQVLPSRRVRVYSEPTSNVATDYQLHRDGRLSNAMDFPDSINRPTVGVWARLTDILPEALNTPMFIEAAEYSAQSNTIAYTTRGAISPLDSLKLRPG